MFAAAEKKAAGRPGPSLAAPGAFISVMLLIAVSRVRKRLD